MSDLRAQYLNRRHFQGLDGIRCVAILAVLWHHSSPPTPLPIFSRGFFGVDLFFVLSGFLISTLLLREKAANGRISLKNFWMRRALRLIPAYYLVLFALLAAYSILKPGSEETESLWSGFPAYALYFSNWIDPHFPNLGPTWSLATEEQFYLVWPLFEAFAAPIVSAAAIVVGVIINQLINFGLLDGAIQSMIGWTPAEHPEILQTTFTPILLGVGLAHALDSQSTHNLVRQIVGFRHASIVYAVILIALLNIPASNISGAMRLALHLAATLFIGSIIVAPTSGLTKALEWKPISFVGAISYGMYLYHMFGLHIASVILQKIGVDASVMKFFLGCAITIVASAASYFFYEKRFLDLRRKFRSAQTISDDH
ncbi:MAG: acyltransferase [Parvularculaceae bacterium]|nr:acyltransferase [Parvularculaceae bacterium]